ncbi:MAG: DUF2244 domain-containing protein [Pseudomonadota bacterium]
MTLAGDSAAGSVNLAAQTPNGGERADQPLLSLDLWPNRSLSGRGRKRFLWLLGSGFSVPLLPLVATKVVWIPLCFVLLVMWAMWYALHRNSADARYYERVMLWPDELRIERHERNGEIRLWHADPYWVRLTLHENARPEQYLTLQGGGREIELGAFLSPEERIELADRIEAAIRDVLRSSPA